jgi:fructose-1-phosphate kinase PfkB-like protein
VSETRFITITLSPLFERTLVTKFLTLGYRNQTISQERLDPSGQGVNITRALYNLGCESHAIVLLGDDLTGRAYHALVAEEGFGFMSIFVEGPTQSQTCILDTGHDQETFITTESVEVKESDLRRLENTLDNTMMGDEIVVFAGPLPAGAPNDYYARLIELVHAADSEAVLISGGQALGEALPAKPELVALSRGECEAYFNIPIRIQEDYLAAACKLREQGADKVLLQLKDSSSALLASDDGQWQLNLPDVMEGTSSGVWEAFLAGFLAGDCKDIPLDESLEVAASAAAFVADEIGVEFGFPEDMMGTRDDGEVPPTESDEPGNN